MRAVMLDVPAHLLAERTRLGLDRHDEMWEGELHMVPPAGNEHGRIQTGLVVILGPLAWAANLEIRSEVGLYDPAVPGQSSYRIPDLLVFDPAVGTERGVEGSAALAVEIASPGDESLAKLPFYERVGVQEYVIVDRITKALRYWVRAGDALVESDTATGVELSCLPVTLRSSDGALHVRTPNGTQRI